MSNNFHITNEFTPAGDQPKAIENIWQALSRGDQHHVLMGVTGSGKTFTMANLIQKLGRPTLIIAPNKTLAGQLFTEFKTLFPNDAVGYFISYYDYYQPEAYLPSTDTYIAKDSSINEDIDKMRHEATQNLFEKPNTIIIASVSCIYGLGSPKSYAEQVVTVAEKQELGRDDFLRSLVDIQYQRNDMQLDRGHFRVRGDTVDILPSHQKDEAIRVCFFGDTIDSISLIDALTGQTLRKTEEVSIYPNSHYVTPRKDLANIIEEIQKDLGERLRELKHSNRLVEMQRLEQRTMQDIEALEQLGFCPGIENYSRYLSGAKPGEPPPCLLDYFPPDYLTIIDESHITVPQIKGMHRGDRARKENLVNFGFRLPAALDNRPLEFSEFLKKSKQIIYVSATPGEFELGMCKGDQISEQVIRPTGLVDPHIFIKDAHTQVDDLLGEIKKTVSAGGRVLVTTLTKKMSEDLTQYYLDLGIKVRYLHSEIITLERAKLLHDLRHGKFGVLIGINLLREGLDLPEVQLVAVMDADKEGFLRSRSSLIQTVGRAARNDRSKVIFYATTITESMQKAIDETNRRREIQIAHNTKHGIVPRTITKSLPLDLKALHQMQDIGVLSAPKSEQDPVEKLARLGVENSSDLEKLIDKRTKAMKKHASKMEFEQAAQIRDEIAELKALFLAFGGE